ncbi:hypothetical protein NDU88_005861 [Pleurodeles waltl]|uniref:Uncharacterized protein n=1 Tax=Pleurodeles waltl TaxID=8319 RepID=A0AAV7L243_PLEWA|nr:hypothetical protein NDU88_005861 [Pleurodeles waltl]
MALICTQVMQVPANKRASPRTVEETLGSEALEHTGKAAEGANMSQTRRLSLSEKGAVCANQREKAQHANNIKSLESEMQLALQRHQKLSSLYASKLQKYSAEKAGEGTQDLPDAHAANEQPPSDGSTFTPSLAAMGRRWSMF